MEVPFEGMGRGTAFVGQRSCEPCRSRIYRVRRRRGNGKWRTAVVVWPETRLPSSARVRLAPPRARCYIDDARSPREGRDRHVVVFVYGINGCCPEEERIGWLR